MNCKCGPNCNCGFTINTTSCSQDSICSSPTVESESDGESESERSENNLGIVHSITDSVEKIEVEVDKDDTSVSSVKKNINFYNNLAAQKQN